MYLSTIAEDTTLRKFASMLDAMALARRVFPSPGAVQQHALRRGDAHAEEQLGVHQRKLDRLSQLADLLAEAADGAVVHVPRGLVSMLYTMGSTSRGNARMMVRVVMSSATRVPLTSFSLSSFVRTPTTYRGPLLALTMTGEGAGRDRSARGWRKKGRRGGISQAVRLPFERRGRGLDLRGRRTLLVVQLTQHLPDDLPHALQRLQIILGLIEGLFRILHLVAQPTDLGVELLQVGEGWRGCGEWWRCALKTSRDPTEGGDRARRVGRSRRRRERVDGAHLMLQHEFPILVDRRGFRVHVARHGVRLAGSFPFVSPRRLLGTCSDLRKPPAPAPAPVFRFAEGLSRRSTVACDGPRSIAARAVVSERPGSVPRSGHSSMTVTLAHG